MTGAAIWLFRCDRSALSLVFLLSSQFLVAAEDAGTITQVEVQRELSSSIRSGRHTSVVACSCDGELVASGSRVPFPVTR
jgi:hypothetical protein